MAVEPERLMTAQAAHPLARAGGQGAEGRDFLFDPARERHRERGRKLSVQKQLQAGTRRFWQVQEDESRLARFGDAPQELWHFLNFSSTGAARDGGARGGRAPGALCER